MITRSLIMAGEGEDYENFIKEFNHSLEDFDLKENNQTIRSNSISIVQGTITIKNKRTGKEKTYKAGQFSSWPSDFHNDLKQGFFNADQI